MPQGLPVSRLINVSVNLSPQAAQGANLNSLVVLGDSDVINVQDRMRSYGSLNEVAEDFSITDPEYRAASLFFGQVPQPNQLYIGRWASTATSGLLVCGILSSSERDMSEWTAIDNGAFKIQIDDEEAAVNITGLDFSGETNLNGVASVINAALATATVEAEVEWDGEKFIFTSDATGTESIVRPLTAGTPGAGIVDISAQLKGTEDTYLQQVNGIEAETPVEAVIILDNLATSWYALTIPDDIVTDDQVVAVAEYIEGSGNPHVLFQTTTNTATLSGASTNDLAARLEDRGFRRSGVQYSENPNAAASFMGRALTTNFNGNNTMLTMMYKTEPAVAPESLTSTQANVLQDKKCNVYVNYNNDTAIIQYGTMASGDYFDEIFGLDWLRNAIQTNVYNLLYTSPTKIPQTDAGNRLIANAIEQVCVQGVTNGLIAPGIWNSAGFGQLQQGAFLDKGFYVYAPPIANQLQADREARKSVPFQVAIKLAGAIHTVDIRINVNR